MKLRSEVTALKLIITSSCDFPPKVYEFFKNGSWFFFKNRLTGEIVLLFVPGEWNVITERGHGAQKNLQVFR